jgi:hypothetical protein
MAEFARCRAPAQRLAQHEAAEHVKKNHRRIGLDEDFTRGQERVTRPQGKMRVLDAAVAHHRECVPDGDAQRRNAAQRLQGVRMTLEPKNPTHRRMLAGQAKAGNARKFSAFRICCG